MQILIVVLVICFLKTSQANTRFSDLSDVPHHVDSEKHDIKFDQEAFVGKDEAKSYAKLTPEESKAKLKKLVETKIDTDHNGKVNKDELKARINYISKKWQLDERDRAWLDYNHSNKNLLDLKSYLDVQYGDEIDKRYSGDELKRILKEIDLDKLKWQLADDDNDGFLNREEFFSFVRPEEFTKMKSFLIDELLSKADKNHDGYLDKNEYIDELYTREPDVKRGVDAEPDWITSETKHFGKHRDSNGDGKLDRHELGEWIMPENYDGVEAEVQHLLSQADADSDEQLSMEEILQNIDLLAGSQLTNYGNKLEEDHEEL